MIPSSRNKSLISIIIFLLAANIFLVLFFVVFNKHTQRNVRFREQNGMAGMLQKDVHFSQDQLNKYLTLRKEQLDSVHHLFDDLREAKMNFYYLIYSPKVSDSTLQLAADLIAQKQITLDLYMFHHFRMVRDICTPDQLGTFDSTIKKVLVRMTGKPGRQSHLQKK
jgi:hypothetical protein